MLSLSIWFLITLSLLPLYHHVSKQSLSIQREEEALRIMYESLQAYLLEGKSENGEVVRGNHSFLIVWQMEAQEVCVLYEDLFNKTKEKCERIE